MSRQILIAFLLPYVQMAVRAIEDKFGSKDVSGLNKRLAAFKMVKDSLYILEHVLGAVGLAVEDNLIFGLIDATVETLHHSGEFDDHSGDVRQYNFIPPPRAFQWTDPKTQAKRWSAIGDKGQLESVKLVRTTGGEMVPIDEQPVRTPAIQFAGTYPEEGIESRQPEPISPDVAGTAAAGEPTDATTTTRKRAARKRAR